MHGHMNVKFVLYTGFYPLEGFRLFTIVQILVYRICFSQHIKEE